VPLAIDGTTFAVFVGALAAGSFLDRCVRRLPLGKSVVWPLGDYCPACFQRVPPIHRLPLVGCFLALGRCRTCRRRLSWRRPIIETVTVALVVGLYYLYVGSGRGFAFPTFQLPYTAERLFALFVYHSLLFGFLIVATFIDLEFWVIPDSVTIPGMLVGILLGTFWYVELHPVTLWRPPYQDPVLIAPQVFVDWFGDPVPPFFEHIREAINRHFQLNWNRWLGFSTGLAGLLIGGGVVWVVRAVCSKVFGLEAMGFGDVTLMAMVGSFLGWQTVILAFFLAPLSAVVVGVLGLLLAGQSALPYGPHLSIATVFVVFFWRNIWSGVFEYFQETLFVGVAGALLVVLLVILAMLVQWAKRLILRIR
jgi:leader peptidase (prepilin peptidase)/N-methyltransferase